MTGSENKNEAPPSVAWDWFLVNAASGDGRFVTEAVTQYTGSQWSVACPELELPCYEKKCGGPRRFKPESQALIQTKGLHNLFICYECRNCEKSLKTYAVLVGPSEKYPGLGWAYKYGEWLPRHHGLPRRLIKLVGDSRHLLLQGRRAELRGLGIGAHAYYRRVVHERWRDFLERARRVAEIVGDDEAEAEARAAFDAALAEDEFSRAADKVKHAIPGVLKIEGQNPFKLLYGATSDGLHNLSDEECLERCEGIRLILAELAERSHAALRKNDALMKPMGRLSQRKKRQRPDPSPPSPPPDDPEPGAHT